VLKISFAGGINFDIEGACAMRIDTDNLCVLCGQQSSLLGRIAHA
jgi:hypothetical protein